MIYFRMD